MKPNFIMLISHDSGRKFSNYGYKVATPNFEKISQNGIQFENYFCPAPQCSPSRGSILTGKYPHNNGLMGLAHLGFSINSNSPTLPQVLQDGGYETTLIGLSHETIHTPPKIEDRIFSSTTELGYRSFIPVDGDRAPKVAETTIHYLENRCQDTPLYLNVGFFETHRDFDEYEPYADQPTEIQLFDFLIDDPKTRKDVALYNGSVKILDQAVGKIFDYIQQSSYKENTYFIFTTDHGVAFPGAKGTLKKQGLETALIMVPPNMEAQQGGIKKNALLCNIDLLPTILELAEIPSPDSIDGKSFASLLGSHEDCGREEFFTELTWHDRYQPMRGIRTNKYNYIRNFEDGPQTYVPVDAHLSLSGEVMRKSCYIPNSPEELYDLENDPEETINVIHLPEYQEICKQLRKKVTQWMHETNDPLLKGPINGYGSRRWEKEIQEGRAYPGRRKYFERLE